MSVCSGSNCRHCLIEKYEIKIAESYRQGVKDGVEKEKNFQKYIPKQRKK